ncbi:hypothetical protein AVEN_6643-1 [Araneus ventricosus]|uniref:Uncharacterized protein n=1 Tax=Araneus ventricosus TaxID=182803 RepID=A0A4Y2H3X6_ARAVE|nr:hypothetical protein AVEN_6643-1 [Araneus ventricosus]
MAALKDTWSAIEIRSVIRSLRSSYEIHHHLVKVFVANVLSRKQVWKHNFLSRFQQRDTGTPSIQPGSRTKGFSSLQMMKKHLAGRHFRIDAEFQEAVVK